MSPSPKKRTHGLGCGFPRNNPKGSTGDARVHAADPAVRVGPVRDPDRVQTPTAKPPPVRAA